MMLDLDLPPVRFDTNEGPKGPQIVIQLMRGYTLPVHGEKMSHGKVQIRHAAKPIKRRYGVC